MSYETFENKSSLEGSRSTSPDIGELFGKSLTSESNLLEKENGITIARLQNAVNQASLKIYFPSKLFNSLDFSKALKSWKCLKIKFFAKI